VKINLKLGKQSYKQERGCLMHFVRLANTLLKDEERKVHETITFLLVTLPNIHRFLLHKVM